MSNLKRNVYSLQISFSRKFSGLFILVLIAHGTLSDTVDLKDAQTLSQGLNDFAFKLLKEIYDTGKNIVFSPYSIHAALSLALMGASPNTATEIRSLLGLPQDEEVIKHGIHELSSIFQTNESVTVETANKIYVGSCNIEEKFQNISQEEFGSSAENLDFGNSQEATKTINKWIEEKTKSKIKDLVKPEMISEDTKMIIVNAIYFLGNWMKRFNENKTKNMDFELSEGGKVEAQMMTDKFVTKYAKNEMIKAKIAMLPYKGNKFGMVIILPDDVHGIDTLVQTLQSDTLKSISKEFEQTFLELCVPKFKFQWGDSLLDPLKKLGMKDSFSTGNFHGICSSADYLSQVLHKAFIEVNERGTEASAVTKVEVTNKAAVSIEGIITEFKVDHPFLFIIQDFTTESILFMGVVNNPVEKVS